MAAGKKQNDKDAMAVINEHIKTKAMLRYICYMGTKHIS